MPALDRARHPSAPGREANHSGLRPGVARAASRFPCARRELPTWSPDGQDIAYNLVTPDPKHPGPRPRLSIAVARDPPRHRRHAEPDGSFYMSGAEPLFSQSRCQRQCHREPARARRRLTGLEPDEQRDHLLERARGRPGSGLGDQCRRYGQEAIDLSAPTPSPNLIIRTPTIRHGLRTERRSYSVPIEQSKNSTSRGTHQFTLHSRIPKSG